MNRDIQNLIDFSKAIAVPLYNTDGLKWPIRSGHIISQVGDLYATEYIFQLQQLVSKYDPSYWKIAVPNSLSIWRMAHHILNGLEKAKIEKNIIAQNCLLMIKVIETITNQDEIFSQSHIILNQSIINDLCFYKGRITEAGKIIEMLSLSTLLWAYAEALYFQGREVCCEYHGPYWGDNGTRVIVRDYENLAPSDLWPNLNFSEEFHNIRIVTFHNEKLSFTIDAYNNVNIPQGNFANSCIGGLVFINGKIASDNVFSNLIRLFSSKLTTQVKYVNSMSDQALYLQYLKIFWYRKKKLADFLSVNWGPPDGAVDRIIHAEIKQSSINKYKTQKGLEFVVRQYNYAKYL